MSIRRRTAGSIFWTVFQNGSRRLVTLVVFLTLARLLEPEHFGLVALAGSAVAFIELFVQIGFAEAIVQRKNLEDEHLDTAFWVMLGIAGVLTLLSIALAEPIAALFNTPELVPVLRWLSLSILLLTLSRVQAAILRRHFKFKKLAIRVLIAALCGGIVGVVMAFNGMGVWALVAQQLVDSAVSLIVLWASSSWRPGLRFSKSHFKDLFGFGSYLMGAQFMYFINQHAARLIIGYFLGTVALGLFSVARRLEKIVQQMVQKTFETVLFSTFSRMQSETERLQAGFMTSSSLIILMVFPVFMFLSVAGYDTVVVLFGEKWSYSGTLIRYLAFASLLLSATAFHGAVFKASGKPQFALRQSIVGSVATVVLTLLAVGYGIEAVAIAMVLRSVILVPYSFYLINQLFPVSFGLMMNQTRGPIIGCASMAAGVYIARYYTAAWTFDFLSLVAMALMGFCCYGVAVWLVDRKLLMDAWDSTRLVLARGGKGSD